MAEGNAGTDIATEKKSDKDEFLGCMNEGNLSGLIHFVSQHKSKKSSFTFEKLLASLNKTELASTWDRIAELVEKSITVLYDADDGESSEKEISNEVATEFVQMSLCLAVLCLDLLDQVHLGLFQMAIFLHDLLPLFPDDNLKNSIALLCEKCWFKEVEGKEEILTNALMYLLTKSVGTGAVKNDIKRVWAFRKALKVVMDHADPVMKDEMLEILKECVISFNYLLVSEGAKFIQYVFCLDPSYVEVFHKAVKEKLPLCSTKQSMFYGEIYYQSWMISMKRGVEDDHLTEEEREELSKLLQDQIEECIQDFMYYGIHLPGTPGSILPHLRKLLSVFHMKRKDYHVLKMLRKLYGPILWRSLKHHSGTIRANAAHLFLDVFPLEDPDFRVVETEAELQKQTLYIKDLLVDECPTVRRITIVGLCNILTYQWELLSSDIINVYLDILVKELARDSTSPAIRRSVIDGLKQVLDNHLAIHALKSRLPRLMPLFHDVSEKVRISFCHLLLAVKKICLIKYWDVVPLTHILARLEEDKPSIAKLLVELIYNSYIPVEQPEENWFWRSVELVKMDRTASQVFFMHVTGFIGLEVTTKFISCICKTLKRYTEVKDPQGCSSYSDEDKENVDDISEVIKMLDDPDHPTIVAGVLDAAVIMFMSVQKDLETEEHKIMYKTLLRKLAKCMPPLLKHFKDSKAWMPLYNLCSFVPSSLLPEFAKICFSQLKNLSENASVDEYTTLLKCLCKLRKSQKVLVLIQDCIAHEFAQYVLKRKKTKKRETRKSKKMAFKPEQAAVFLETLLKTPSCKFTLLEDNVEEMEDIVENIDYLLEAIEDLKLTLSDEHKKEFLAKVFSSIIRIAVILHPVTSADADKFIRRMLSWISEVFLSKELVCSVRKKRVSVKNKRLSTQCGTPMWKNLGQTICKDILSVAADVMIMNILKVPATDYVQFLKNVIHSDYGHEHLARCINVLLRISESCKLQIVDQKLREQNQVFIPDVFSDIVDVLVDENFHMIRSNVKMEVKGLRLLLVSQSTKRFESDNTVTEVMSKLLDGILGGMMSAIDNHTDEEEICLPSSSLCLISTVTAHISVLKLFLQTIQKCITDKDILKCSAVCLIMSKALKDTRSNLTKVEDIVLELIDVLQENLTEFSSVDTSERENCLIALMKSSLANLSLLFKKDVSCLNISRNLNASRVQAINGATNSSVIAAQ